MVKFGGTGKSKQACLDRVCENMTVENDQTETSGDEDENDSTKANSSKGNFPKDKPINGKKSLQINLKDCAIPVTRMNSGNNKSQVEWIGEPLDVTTKKTFYRGVRVHDETRSVGDYVYGTDGNVCRIVNLFETKGGKCHAHLQEFTPGKATILGETS